MGNTFGDITPLDTSVNCAAVQQDARWDYRCSTSWQSRLGLTTIHLIIMVAVYFLTVVIYAISLQIVERRKRLQLSALPARTLPVRKATAPRSLYRQIVSNAARLSSETLLIPPPASNLIASPRGWGSGSYENVHFKAAVAQIGTEIEKLIEAVVPADVRGSVRGRSLTSFTDYFVGTHGAPRELITELAAAVDRAIYLDDYEFTPEEYARVAAAWLRLTRILADNSGGSSAISSNNSSSTTLAAQAGAVLSPLSLIGVLSLSGESPLVSGWEGGPDRAFVANRDRTPTLS